MKGVGVVVPTLGTRGEYFATCLQSLKDSNVAHVCVVCPSHVDVIKFIEDGLVHQKVDDPGKGLASCNLTSGEFTTPNCHRHQLAGRRLRESQLDRRCAFRAYL